jgi:itaconate CoA-transferase
VASLVDDRACVQIGVGGLPQAVCEELRDRADLGIHSEVFTPALADLVRRGVVTGRYKTLNRGKAVFTFAMGDRDTYQFMNDNIALESYPVDYVNDPAVIAQNDDVISVNSTVEMDLTGACNSEHVNGHQFSGAGGQLDFVRGAYASRGGKSVIAFASTTRGGTISKIVPRLSGPVTTPRNDIHYVATEYGLVNLKALSSTERAAALIGLAHPDYRGWLSDNAQRMHLI